MNTRKKRNLNARYCGFFCIFIFIVIPKQSSQEEHPIHQQSSRVCWIPGGKSRVGGAKGSGRSSPAPPAEGEGRREYLYKAETKREDNLPAVPRDSESLRAVTVGGWRLRKCVLPRSTHGCYYQCQWPSMDVHWYACVEADTTCTTSHHGGPWT